MSLEKASSLMAKPSPALTYHQEVSSEGQRYPLSGPRETVRQMYTKREKKNSSENTYRIF